MKRKLMLAALAAATIVALGSTAALICTIRAVHSYEEHHGVQILFPENENPLRNKKMAASKARKPGEAYLGESGQLEHVIEEGEDVVSIAIKYGVSPAALLEINDLKSYHITTNTVIRLPDYVKIDESGRIQRRTDDNGTNAPPQRVPPCLKVAKVEYDGETEIEVFLSARPDMENARRYVEVSPLREGVVGLRYREWGNKPRIVVTGDFAHRTNVTLRVRKGLPIYGGAEVDPTGAQSLTEDFSYVFQRKDAHPKVAFADKGRYLPPMGSRSVAVESVNVSKLRAEVRRVVPHNVVQMLAREE